MGEALRVQCLGEGKCNTACCTRCVHTSPHPSVVRTPIVTPSHADRVCVGTATPGWVGFPFAPGHGEGPKNLQAGDREVLLTSLPPQPLPSELRSVGHRRSQTAPKIPPIPSGVDRDNRRVKLTCHILDKIRAGLAAESKVTPKRFVWWGIGDHGPPPIKFELQVTTTLYRHLPTGWTPDRPTPPVTPDQPCRCLSATAKLTSKTSHHARALIFRRRHACQRWLNPNVLPRTMALKPRDCTPREKMDAVMLFGTLECIMTCELWLRIIPPRPKKLAPDLHRTDASRVR